MTPDKAKIYKDKMKALRCCVIIPTYNNEQTLAQVISSVLDYSEDVIVVNDGATDSTAEILLGFPQVRPISYSPNRGKGMALRRGIRAAAAEGFRYAITIDSDGQHFADDIPAFVDKIEQEPDALLIGARNLQQENMPKKNTFGNRFSNFWFHLFTGIDLPDTQSGYRLYPLERMKGTRYFCSKYEFEVEVSVKAAWKGIAVLPVPIRVFYAEGNKRISHFRPGKDFTRISLLNTYLFFPALLWYRPLRLIRGLTLENIRTMYRKHFLDTGESTGKKSTAVAFGVFMGIIPIWGYQLVSALLLAHVFKLNKVIVGLAANISIPPMIPLLLYGSLKTGQIILQKDISDNIFNTAITTETVKIHLVEYLIGSVVFAIVLALLAWIITYFSIRRYRLRKIKTAGQE